MSNPTIVSHEVESIKTSYFWRANDRWQGVAYDNLTGQEFDIRQLENGKWLVNDDYGRDFVAKKLQKALRKAIEANE